MAVGAGGAVEQIVRAGEGFVQQRNEIVFQHHGGFHVQIVLAAEKLQLLSHGVHRSMFPQTCPVVKPVFGDFESVLLIALDFADRTTAALLDDDGIEDADVDAELMQSSRDGFVIAPCSLHDDARVLAKPDDLVS